jgi:hypothetical protein
VDMERFTLHERLLLTHMPAVLACHPALCRVSARVSAAKHPFPCIRGCTSFPVYPLPNIRRMHSLLHSPCIRVSNTASGPSMWRSMEQPMEILRAQYLHRHTEGAVSPSAY